MLREALVAVAVGFGFTVIIEDPVIKLLQVPRLTETNASV